MKKRCLLLVAVLYGLCGYAQKFAYGTGTDLWGKPTLEDYLEAKSLGFDYVELAPSAYGGGSTHEEVVSSSQDMKRQLGEARMKVWSIHLPYGGSNDISSTDESTRKATVKRMCLYIKALAEVFSPHAFVLHPSGEPISDAYREQHIQQAIKSLPEIADAAREAGVLLCVENLPRTCLGNTPEELLRIVTTVPDVRITFDTNHYLKGTIEHFMRTAGHLIGHIHVSDYDFNDEKHWLPTLGKVNWGELMHQLEEAGYDGVFMSESEKTLEGPATIQGMKETYDQIFAQFEAMKDNKVRLEGYLDGIRKQFFEDVPMDSVFATGTRPGFYSEEAYTRFATAYEAAQEAVKGTATDAECVTLREETGKALEELLEAVNPVTDGYYWFVSGHEGFAAPDKTMGMYTDKGGVMKWGSFKPSLDFLFKVTRLDNGYFTIQHVGTDAFVGSVDGSSDPVPTTLSHQVDQALVPYGKFGMFAIYNMTNSVPYHTEGHREGAGTGGNIINWKGYPGSGSSWYVQPVEGAELEALLSEKAEQEALNKDYLALKPVAGMAWKEANRYKPLSEVTLRLSQVTGSEAEKFYAYKDMIDGDYTTYYQSVCSGDGPMETPYIQIDARKSLDNFGFSLVPCLENGDQRPDMITVQGALSKEGPWIDLTRIDYGLPVAKTDTLYTSVPVATNHEKGYRYLRLVINHTVNNYGAEGGTQLNGYYPFRMAELKLYEAMELDPDCLGARADMQQVCAALKDALDKADAEYLNEGVTRKAIDALQAAYQAFLDCKEQVMTGIELPGVSAADVPVNVYGMDGKLLMRNTTKARALRSLPAGIYIIGGQKVEVR